MHGRDAEQRETRPQSRGLGGGECWRRRRSDDAKVERVQCGSVSSTERGVGDLLPGTRRGTPRRLRASLAAESDNTLRHPDRREAGHEREDAERHHHGVPRDAREEQDDNDHLAEDARDAGRRRRTPTSRSKRERQ